ncbi:fibronectin type III domain-containing protein [Malonomonas rubra]|uniref:fibronectin type III domain-containing protein n=1 Tax=Malonomonas rubra TaxID=57040 RepID=UPI0026F0D892|nr:fibronectin type III domain-containing protein [Malonomonas rubra]
MGNLIRIFRHIVLLSCITFITACGNKGPVRLPVVPLPATVQAPEMRQQGDALLLSWQLPSKNQDGSPLEQPPIVDIYRMTYDPQDDCPECLDRSSLLVSINPQLPKPAQQVDKRYLLHDRPLQPGTGYQYKFITRNQDGEQSRPIILRQPYLEPLQPPQQVVATAHDRSVSLQWQAPQLAEGDSLLGYFVYRHLDSKTSPFPLNSKPLQQEKFEDFSLENGTRYHYRVRALVKRGNLQLEGLASPALNVIPKAGI